MYSAGFGMFCGIEAAGLFGELWGACLSGNLFMSKAWGFRVMSGDRHRVRMSGLNEVEAGVDSAEK